MASSVADTAPSDYPNRSFTVDHSGPFKSSVPSILRKHHKALPDDISDEIENAYESKHFWVQAVRRLDDFDSKEGEVKTEDGEKTETRAALEDDVQTWKNYRLKALERIRARESLAETMDNRISGAVDAIYELLQKEISVDFIRDLFVALNKIHDAIREGAENTSSVGLGIQKNFVLYLLARVARKVFTAYAEVDANRFEFSRQMFLTNTEVMEVNGIDYEAGKILFALADVTPVEALYTWFDSTTGTTLFDVWVRPVAVILPNDDHLWLADDSEGARTAAHFFAHDELIPKEVSVGGPGQSYDDISMPFRGVAVRTFVGDVFGEIAAKLVSPLHQQSVVRDLQIGNRFNGLMPDMLLVDDSRYTPQMVLYDLTTKPHRELDGFVLFVRPSPFTALEFAPWLETGNVGRQDWVAHLPYDYGDNSDEPLLATRPVRFVPAFARGTIPFRFFDKTESNKEGPLPEIRVYELASKDGAASLKKWEELRLGGKVAVRLANVINVFQGTKGDVVENVTLALKREPRRRYGLQLKVLRANGKVDRSSVVDTWKPRSLGVSRLNEWLAFLQHEAENPSGRAIDTAFAVVPLAYHRELFTKVNDDLPEMRYVVKGEMDLKPALASFARSEKSLFAYDTGDDPFPVFPLFEAGTDDRPPLNGPARLLSRIVKPVLPGDWRDDDSVPAVVAAVDDGIRPTRGVGALLAVLVGTRYEHFAKIYDYFNVNARFLAANIDVRSANGKAAPEARLPPKTVDLAGNASKLAPPTGDADYSGYVDHLLLLDNDVTSHAEAIYHELVERAVFDTVRAEREIAPSETGGSYVGAQHGEAKDAIALMTRAPTECTVFVVVNSYEGFTNNGTLVESQGPVTTLGYDVRRGVAFAFKRSDGVFVDMKNNSILQTKARGPWYVKPTGRVTVRVEGQFTADVRFTLPLGATKGLYRFESDGHFVELEVEPLRGEKDMFTLLMIIAGE